MNGLMECAGDLKESEDDIRVKSLVYKSVLISLRIISSPIPLQLSLQF
jgi:hypothetical protein